MAALRATRLYSKCCSCFSSSFTNSATRSRTLQRSLCSTDQVTDQQPNAQSLEEEPNRRKEFRRYRSRICRQNRANPELERKARLGNLIINLDEVNKVWMAREGLQHIHKLAKHYQIYEHVFGGVEFTPTKLMDITYGDSDGTQVHWGNFITPSQASSSPSVSFDSNTDDLWSLILVNPDGNIWYKDAELLHWFVANIPGNDISQGQEIVEYLAPIPSKGTGYHRFVFCLLQQKEALDVQKLISSHSSFSSQRSFNLTDLLSRHQGLLPTGLSFFQAAWDDTVSKTYSHIVGILEPVYDVKPFVTPTKQRKHTTKDTFDHKYKNM